MRVLIYPAGLGGPVEYHVTAKCGDYCDSCGDCIECYPHDGGADWCNGAVLCLYEDEPESARRIAEVRAYVAARSSSHTDGEP